MATKKNDSKAVGRWGWIHTTEGWTSISQFLFVTGLWHWPSREHDQTILILELVLEHGESMQPAGLDSLTIKCYINKTTIDSVWHEYFITITDLHCLLSPIFKNPDYSIVEYKENEQFSAVKLSCSHQLPLFEHFSWDSEKTKGQGIYLKLFLWILWQRSKVTV